MLKPAVTSGLTDNDSAICYALLAKKRKSNMSRILKRVIDLVIAFVSLVILSPLLIICILVLLCTGEHEIFFLQKRVGYKNQLFNIIKFATMLKNSPNMGTGEITLRNDPRVTRFGKILRMTKLNELPQIFNVLTGDMSIVGPRPLMSVSFKQYPEEVQRVIYNCKPGMTGLGSLIFRDEEKIVSEADDPKAMYKKIYEYKWALEIWYQEHESFATDFKIIFLTAWSIIFPSNKLVYRFFKSLPPRPL
ncbi:MAG TPA: sugar transferase [Ferruginibacter sp.]|nr:sugar transferase [Ferruginibacter sp.]